MTDARDMTKTDAKQSVAAELQYAPIPSNIKQFHLFRHPLRLTRIVTSKNHRTNPKLIEKILESIYTPQIATAQQIFENNALQQFYSLGLFKRVTATLRKDNEYLVQEDYIPVYLDIDFQEKWREFSAQTTISEEGSGLEMKGSLLNMFGNRENLTASYFGNARSSRIMKCEFSRPFNPLEINSSILSLGAFQDSFSRKNCGFEEVSRGIVSRCNFDLNNIFSYEFSWRDLNFVPSASMDVRSSAEDTVKSSIKWKHIKDLRDNRISPNEGLAYQVTTELAGLGGNVRFLKTDAAVEYYRPLPISGWVARGYMRGGSVIPWGGDRLRLNDRLVEPNLRGFSKGVGPASSKGEMLGGNLVLSGGIDIYSPILFGSPNKMALRGHSFLNFGNLVSTTGLGADESIKQLFDTKLTRLSIGAGLVLDTPVFGRLELDYSIPLKSLVGDKASRGMHFGFGFRLV